MTASMRGITRALERCCSLCAPVHPQTRDYRGPAPPAQRPQPSRTPSAKLHTSIRAAPQTTPASQAEAATLQSAPLLLPAPPCATLTNPAPARKAATARAALALGFAACIRPFVAPVAIVSLPHSPALQGPRITPFWVPASCVRRVNSALAVRHLRALTARWAHTAQAAHQRVHLVQRALLAGTAQPPATSARPATTALPSPRAPPRLVLLAPRARTIQVWAGHQALRVFHAARAGSILAWRAPPSARASPARRASLVETAR
jgi:hypothetical protein